MKARTASMLAWALVLVCVGLIGAGLSIGLLGGASLAGFGVIGTTLILTFPLMGALIASRRPGNPIGWIFCAVGLSFGLATLATAWADYALVKDPGALPLGRFMSWVSVWAWPPGVVLLFTFLLLLYPDGRLPSRRWRPAAWLSGLALVLTVMPVAITAWPIRGTILTNIGESAPAAASDSFKIAYNLQVGGIVLVFALGLVAAGSLIIRMRRARGDEREQIKWFAFAAAVLVIVVILASPLFHIGDQLQVLTFPLIPLASAVAILKYRLYDIDVVINKAVVVTALAAFATAVYLAVVVGIGAAIGTRGKPNVVLSIVATAVVALAFQPLRERARRLANRLVYGKRATPYEVLSDFSDRMAGAYSVEDILPRMVRVLGDGTGASRAEVWLRVGSELRRAESWPNESAPTGVQLPVGADDELPAIPGVDRAVAVRHQGELLGALALAKPPNEPLTPAEEKLLSDLASQAGLVVRNVRLTVELQARLEELRTSRQRLVTAQDEERRRIERDLHDGAQQQLVALSVKLRLAEHLAERDPSRAREMLQQLQTETGDALENLRDLARGIYPPLLADKGLAAALEAQARKSPVPVIVKADRVGRYPQDVEAAVYFCCLEALQNVTKYAHASRVVVRLSAEDGQLTFGVSDDGEGFDPKTTPLGTGLQGMADRAEALGGTLEVRSEAGTGTTVTGRIPVPAMEPIR